MRISTLVRSTTANNHCCHEDLIDETEAIKMMTKAHNTDICIENYNIAFTCIKMLCIHNSIRKQFDEIKSVAILANMHIYFCHEKAKKTRKKFYDLDFFLKTHTVG